MTIKNFQGTVFVWIQGSKVLNFEKFEKDTAVFSVVGSNNPKIYIYDSRPDVVNTMHKIEKSGKVKLLAPVFNTPGKITIVPPKKRLPARVLIDKPRGNGLNYMLWIAVGIDEILNFNYLFADIRLMKNGKFAFFSLYRRPRI